MREFAHQIVYSASFFFWGGVSTYHHYSQGAPRTLTEGTPSAFSSSQKQNLNAPFPENRHFAARFRQDIIGVRDYKMWKNLPLYTWWHDTSHAQ